MLRRMLIILAELLLGLVLVVAGILFWASYHVDTPEFRQEFVHVLNQVTSQKVILDGDLDIVLYPSLSLDVESLAINGEDDDTLARFDNLLISLRLIPLLSKRLEVRSIVVEGMEIRIVISEDGRSNWRSMIQQRDVVSNVHDSGGFPFSSVSLSGLEVINASINYSDQRSGERYTLQGINLRTGIIQSGRSVPFSASSQFTWGDREMTSHLKLAGRLSTDAEGHNLTLDDGTLYASIEGDFLPRGANPGELTSRVLVDFSKRIVTLDGIQARFMGIRGEGHLVSGDLKHSLVAQGQLTINRFRPSSVLGRYFPDLPLSSVEGLSSASFDTDFTIDDDGFSLEAMQLVLDSTKVNGTLSLANYHDPSVEFRLHGGSFDLDRYLPLFETETPFVWDDFGLPFWERIKGSGEVAVDSFKVLNETFTGVTATAKAGNNAITLQGNGVRSNGGSIAIHTLIQIEGSADPTFAGEVSFALHSKPGQTEVVNSDSLLISGIQSVSGRLKVSKFSCPPQDRSIDLLRHMSGTITTSLASGALQRTKDQNTIVSYSSGSVDMTFSPLSTEYGYRIDCSVHGQGGTFDVLSFNASGPLDWSIDGGVVSSRSLMIQGHVAGPFVTKRSDRFSVKATVGFSSDSKETSIRQASIRALDTTVAGDCTLIDSPKGVIAQGRMEVKGANPHRLIYLTTGKTFATRDPKALTQLRFSSDFYVNSDGFRFNSLEGELDGMSLSGQLIGTGMEDPQLFVTLNAGEFDLDRYRSPKIDAPSDNVSGPQRHKEPPIELPLDLLSALRLQGAVAFESFTLAQITSRPLSGVVQAEKGDIHIGNIVGTIHQGSLVADWKGKIAAGHLNTKLMLHIEDMRAGPLMTEMFGREYIKGETDFDADLQSVGATDQDIVNNLSGKTWVRIRNGSYKFSGYDRMATTTQPTLVKEGKGKTENVPQRTVFQKALAYFSVENGIFTADRFRIEAPPVLQSYGTGHFSLPDNSINLAIRNDFLAVPSVTVRLTGALDNPEVSVPKGKIVNDTVRNILSIPEKSFNFLKDLFN